MIESPVRKTFFAVYGVSEIDCVIQEVSISDPPPLPVDYAYTSMGAYGSVMLHLLPLGDAELHGWVCRYSQTAY